MRICLFGGPCSGKSTTAARLFSELKERNIPVEHVSEYLKSWAYSKREIKEFDQIFLFAQQQQNEYCFISNGVKNIVTDCPCFLSVFYAKEYVSDELGDAIWKLCEIYDRKYPVCNIFLDRGNITYQQKGRYQDEETAKLIDTKIWDMMVSYYGKNCIKIPLNDKSLILDTVTKICDL